MEIDKTLVKYKPIKFLPNFSIGFCKLSSERLSKSYISSCACIPGTYNTYFVHYNQLSQLFKPNIISNRWGFVEAFSQNLIPLLVQSDLNQLLCCASLFTNKDGSIVEGVFKSEDVCVCLWHGCLSHANERAYDYVGGLSSEVCILTSPLCRTGSLGECSQFGRRASALDDHERGYAKDMWVSILELRKHNFFSFRFHSPERCPRHKPWLLGGCSLPPST